MAVSNFETFEDDVPAAAPRREARLPSARERSAANQLRQILSARLAEGGAAATLPLRHAGETFDVALTPGLSQLLIELLDHVGHGEGVALVPLGRMLTTQEAADILNVSRPHLIDLLDKARIPYERVGRHRRIRAEHLFAYKRERDRLRGDALADLAGLDADLL